MDAYEFWKQSGKAATEEFCRKCGTNYAYFKHIANRRKRPGADLARRMVTESGGLLTLDSLLISKDELRK